MSKIATYITKVSKFSSRVTLANFFLSISLIRLVVNRAFIAVYVLYISFSSSANLTSALLKEKKGIPKITSMLMLASKKVSLKNQIFPRLFWSKKLAEAIL